MLVTVYNCHNMVYKLAKNYTCMAYKMRKTPIIPTFCIRDATFQYRTLPPQICVRMHQIDSIFQIFWGRTPRPPAWGSCLRHFASRLRRSSDQCSVIRPIFIFCLRPTTASIRHCLCPILSTSKTVHANCMLYTS